MCRLGAIQKGRHRGGEGGREAKLVTKSDWEGGEVVWISDVLISKKIIVVFLSSPDYCNCVSYKINSLASFYFISFEEKSREFNSLWSDLMYHCYVLIKSEYSTVHAFFL